MFYHIFVLDGFNFLMGPLLFGFSIPFSGSFAYSFKEIKIVVNAYYSDFNELNEKS